MTINVYRGCKTTTHTHTTYLFSKCIFLQDKSKSQGKGGEGIWGKIGGLFTRKGKNEMILPDDKEPSVSK